MKFIKYAAFFAALAFALTKPTNVTADEPSGGIFLFNTYRLALNFCSQDTVECLSIEYMVHPVHGTGWSVAYNVVDPVNFELPPPSQGSPITTTTTTGGGSGNNGSGGSGSGGSAPPPTM